MFHHRFNDDVSYRTYLDWFLLSFLAGNINTGGYLSCQRFVSHITGFASLAGISAAEGSWLDSLGALTIPLFFLFGVMVSGYLTEKKYVNRVHGERYAPVMGLVALLLGFVALGGTFDFFGTFGEAINIKHDFLLLACLCGACGLQNAAISSASGATIRTTHLTGLTTDLGLGLIRAEVHRLSDAEKKLERKSNFIRIASILSFTTGSFFGALIYVRYKYQGFLFPMSLALYLSWMAKKRG